MNLQQEISGWENAFNLFTHCLIVIQKPRNGFGNIVGLVIYSAFFAKQLIKIGNCDYEDALK